MSGETVPYGGRDAGGELGLVASRPGWEGSRVMDRREFDSLRQRSATARHRQVWVKGWQVLDLYRRIQQLEDTLAARPDAHFSTTYEAPLLVTGDVER